MCDLSKIKLGVSPITGEIFLYRHGRDVELALEKRPAEADVMAAFVGHMMFEAPDGMEKDIRFGDKKFTVNCRPTPKT